MSALAHALTNGSTETEAAPSSPATSATPAASVPKWRAWTGRVIGALVVLFMAADGGFKVIQHPAVLEASAKFGWSPAAVTGIGWAALISTALYAIPRTSVLGAALLTAFFGGAVSSHVHTGSAFWFPVLMGVLTWASLWARDPRVAQLLPLRAR